ncbi:hypothetical protein RZO07_10130 [Pseudomonas protegens]|uniref:hypothetical protein n=1 Tax=Pseudomonas protegens TaxID=380021 RepID=UPI00293749DF|nr:hypothetical protein [Pseudomonas protegens]WOE81559.1 hypothetical protein RZO07_10130 [Pseudomonas protegens]
MSKLSYRMHDTLRGLHKRPDCYYGSCTNSTMNALKRRGLVDMEWSEVPDSIYRREKWVITPEGVAALNSKATEGASHG